MACAHGMYTDVRQRDAAGQGWEADEPRLGTWPPVWLSWAGHVNSRIALRQDADLLTTHLLIVQTDHGNVFTTRPEMT